MASAYSNDSVAEGAVKVLPCFVTPSGMITSPITSIRRDDLSGEHHSNSPFTTPYDVTMVQRLSAQDVERELMRNAQLARKVQCCARRREVTYCAIDRKAIELNRCRFENPLPLD